MKLPRFLQIFFLFVIIILVSWLLSPFLSWWRAMPLFVFLFSLVIYWGFNESVLWQGIVYAFIGELLLGLHGGTFAFSFLGVLVLLFLVQRFVEIQPLSRQAIPQFGHSWFGSIAALVLGYLGIALSNLIIERWIYQTPVQWQADFAFIIQPWTIGYTVIGLLAAIILLRVTEKEVL